MYYWRIPLYGPNHRQPYLYSNEDKKHGRHCYYDFLLNLVHFEKSDEAVNTNKAYYLSYLYNKNLWNFLAKCMFVLFTAE